MDADLYCEFEIQNSERYHRYWMCKHCHSIVWVGEDAIVPRWCVARIRNQQTEIKKLIDLLHDAVGQVWSLGFRLDEAQTRIEALDKLVIAAKDMRGHIQKCDDDIDTGMGIVGAATRRFDAAVLATREER